VRHGHQAGEVTLGGRRVPVERPRVRAADGSGEVPLQTYGVKLPLGLWDDSTENATVARHLLADLVDRGLDVEQGVLCVLDGGKALRSAVDDAVLGPCRCSGASATRNAMCSTTSPSATARRSSAACARPGSWPITQCRRAPRRSGRRARALAPRRRGVAQGGP